MIKSFICSAESFRRLLLCFPWRCALFRFLQHKRKKSHLRSVVRMWPDKTEDLDYFYPTDVLVTGYDIIFFWVIRMIFSGYEQMGKAPFHTVLFHGLVRDSQGRKMSKSLGNGIDPLEVIDKYGADELHDHPYI